MNGGWLRDERLDVAAERILAAAGEVYAKQGIGSTSMADVARAARCSRATVYRYFPNRDALRVAFVHKATRYLGAIAAHEITEGADPGDALVNALLMSVRSIRAQPELAAWFRPADSGPSAQLVTQSKVIENLVIALLADVGLSDDDAVRTSRFLVRIAISLLETPGASDEEEREMLDEFLAPAIRRQSAYAR